MANYTISSMMLYVCPFFESLALSYGLYRPRAGFKGRVKPGWKKQSPFAFLYFYLSQMSLTTAPWVVDTWINIYLVT